MESGFVCREPVATLDSEHELAEYRLIEGERAQIWSTDGVLLREYSGFYEPGIPEEDWPVIYGQVLVHYHVNDTAFSKNDLIIAATFNLSEIRVISRSMVFSMKRQGTRWPDHEKLAELYDRCERDSRLVNTIEMTETSPAFLESSWDPELDLLKIRTVCISRHIAKECGLEFHARVLHTTLAGGTGYHTGIPGA